MQDVLARRGDRRLASAISVTVALVFAGGCASLGGLDQHSAVASARTGACDSRAADSTCGVRSVERVDGGYRVILDRRPPAGNDRVAVFVRGGLIGGSRT